MSSGFPEEGPCKGGGGVRGQKRKEGRPRGATSQSQQVRRGAGGAGSLEGRVVHPVGGPGQRSGVGRVGTCVPHPSAWIAPSISSFETPGS